MGNCRYLLTWVIAGLALGLQGCTEPLNWRVIPLGDSGWEAMMPCKPVEAQREVSLSGQKLMLDMRSCDAQGVTFSVAWMPLGAAIPAQEALAMWREASQRSAQAEVTGAPVPWPLPGAVLAQRWQGQGKRLDARSVPVSLGHAVVAQHMVQLAAYGAADQEVDLMSFWGGLALRRR